MTTTNTPADAAAAPAARSSTPARGHDGARHLFHVFASFGLGGVPIRITAVMNHFGPRYRHTIVATDGCYDATRRIAAAIPLLDPPPPAHARRRWPLALLDMRRALNEARPDLLLTYNWGALDWALANRWAPVCPHVHFESGFGPDEARRQLPRRVAYRRLALGRRTPLVVPSLTLARIATEIWRLDRRRVHHVPNGVDHARFAIARSESFRDHYLPQGERLLVGTLAPLRREKNIGRLLRAFAAVYRPERHHLVIVGDGAERPALEQEAARLGIAAATTFTGHTEDIERALAAFDLFAISSDTEQMPNALLQAMAAGLPVAGLDVGDVKHLVAPENRPHITPPGDEGAFAGALRALLADDAQRAHIGACNRARVIADYDMPRMYRAYETIFDATGGPLEL